MNNPTPLEFKCEDENDDGVPVGLLTSSDGEAILRDGGWVTLSEARQFARSRGVQLIET